MTLAFVTYLVLGLGIVVWTITGGADLGGGVLDLLLRRAPPEDRRAVEHAIAPIWEANHVWLIFVVVILFSAFPSAFALVSTTLHVPLVVALFGIVLRGTAFTFRSYGMAGAFEQAGYGVLFALGSAVVPVFFGMALAASASSRIAAGATSAAPLSTWASPFAVSTGLFALALFVLVAAAHLAADAHGAEVRARFARRVVGLELVAGAFAALVLALCRHGAPDLFAGLLGSSWSIPLQLLTAAAAAVAMTAAARGRGRVARAAVVVQVALVVAGFGAAMRGALVLPDVTLASAAAPTATLRAVLVAAVAGSVGLVPSLLFLYRVARAPLVDAAGPEPGAAPGGEG